MPQISWDTRDGVIDKEVLSSTSSYVGGKCYHSMFGLMSKDETARQLIFGPTCSSGPWECSKRPSAHAFGGVRAEGWELAIGGHFSNVGGGADLCELRCLLHPGDALE